jgi:hypothetical protein
MTATNLWRRLVHPFGGVEIAHNPSMAHPAKGEIAMSAPIRLTFSGGALAEILTLIPQLRPVTLCKTTAGFEFLFYDGKLLGGPSAQERLADLLGQIEASAEILSGDRLEDLLQDATPIHGLIIDFFRKKDEKNRTK